MSTILDALRKVEEERRVSGHSTRERLLFFPQAAPLPSPSRKGIWVIGLVLMGMGFAGGVGTMLLRSGPAASIPIVPSDPPTTVAALSHPLERSSSWSTPMPQTHSEGLYEPGVGGSPLSAAVQRSPLVTSKSPYAREQSLYSKQLSAASVSKAESSGTGRRSELSTPSIGERNEQNLPNKQLYKQSQDTPEAQAPIFPLPLGIPKVSLNLLQWSPDVDRRLAFIGINGGPMLMIHEGDTVADFTIKRILPDGVELGFGNSTFVVKPYANSSSPAPLAP